MDALQPILPFLGWVVLGIAGLISAIGLFTLQGMIQKHLDTIAEMNSKVNNHEVRIKVLEVLEKIENF